MLQLVNSDIVDKNRKTEQNKTKKPQTKGSTESMYITHIHTFI